MRLLWQMKCWIMQMPCLSVTLRIRGADFFQIVKRGHCQKNMCLMKKHRLELSEMTRRCTGIIITA